MFKECCGYTTCLEVTLSSTLISTPKSYLSHHPSSRTSSSLLLQLRQQSIVLTPWILRWNIDEKRPSSVTLQGSAVHIHQPPLPRVATWKSKKPQPTMPWWSRKKLSNLGVVTNLRFSKKWALIINLILAPLFVISTFEPMVCACGGHDGWVVRHQLSTGVSLLESTLLQKGPQLTNEGFNRNFQVFKFLRVSWNQFLDFALISCPRFFRNCVYATPSATRAIRPCASQAPQRSPVSISVSTSVLDLISRFVMNCV